MIFNESVLCKMIRKAYKDGLLRVGMYEGEEPILIITSGWWIVNLSNDHIPNKIKAAIVECAGEMPEPGELWEIHEEGNQALMLSVDYNAFHLYDKAVLEAHRACITPVILMQQVPARVYQYPFGDKNETIIINDITTNLMAAPSLDTVAEETSASGPMIGGERYPRYLAWSNHDTGALTVCEREPRKGHEVDKTVLDLLQGGDISEIEA